MASKIFIIKDQGKGTLASVNPLKLLELSSNSSGGNISIPYIDVEIGTPAATALGLIDGATVYGDLLMENRQVSIIRNTADLPSINWQGNSYFTKNLADTFLTFSDALNDEERIKIIIH